MEDSKEESENHSTWNNVGRRMMSRKGKGKIRISQALAPGITTPGCLVCCSAPACCPIMSMLPCCNDPEYIHVKKESSKYIYIRENSVEWNMPSVVMKQGSCCGIDPCIYEVQDNIKVLYFDDPIFNRISDQTRCCNDCQTCLFGGQGERIQIDSPCCLGICQRTTCPCLCTPICCPNALVPCVLKLDIYTRDAQKGKHVIEQARVAALSSFLYNDEVLTAAELTTIVPGGSK